MGGFHLSGAEVEAIIPETVRDLGEFALKRIVPCHCTGWRAVHALAQVYKDDVLVPAASWKIVRLLENESVLGLSPLDCCRNELGRSAVRPGCLD